MPPPRVEPPLVGPPLVNPAPGDSPFVDPSRPLPTLSRLEARRVTAAADRWCLEHPRTWPADYSRCPSCHGDGLRAWDENPRFWECLGAGHVAPGIGNDGWFRGDTLDFAAHAAGLSRVELLRREGYLPGAPPAPEPGSDIETEPQRSPPAHATLPEFIRRMAPVGKRLQSGFAALDEATRGGIPAGRLIVVVGAPGAAKTSIATQWAHQWERDGAVVAILAADEPLDGIVTRVGQLAGYNRSDLEAETPEGTVTRELFARASEPRRLLLFDGEEATIEDAGEALLAAAGDRPRVLVVDSLQTVRCLAAMAAESLRERITATVAECKRIAKSGALVVAVSEMARSGYRGQGADAGTLATAKESGAIEYGAALLLGLRSVKGEVGMVDVDVAKNRLGGSKPEFRLRMDFDRACLSEVALPDKDDVKVAAESKREREIRKAIRKALLKYPSLRSRRQLVAAVPMRAAHVYSALDRLEPAGDLVKRGGVYVWAGGEDEGAENEND